MESNGMLPGLGTPTKQTPVDQGGDMAPNVTPEEQSQYESVVSNGMKMAYSPETRRGIVERMKSNPVQGLAAVTASIVIGLEDSAAKSGATLSPEALFHGGADLLADLAAFAGETGTHKYTEQEREAALYAALDAYATQKEAAGTLDRTPFEQDLKLLLEADQNGTIDDLIPGITGKATEIRDIESRSKKSTDDGDPLAALNEQERGLIEYHRQGEER